MSTSNLGTLPSTPRSFSDATVTTGDPKDTYKFRTTGTSNINLSLNEISFGDDADLRLYRDSNRNGRLDSRDRLVEDSTNSSNQDDAINVRAGAGTYFAQVLRYAEGSSGSVTYDLDLSATPPAPTSSASNLLPVEFNVVRPPLGDDGFELLTFTGSVGNSNTADVYAFSIEPGQVMNIDLFEGDPNVHFRLIEDLNGNHIIDLGLGELLFSSSDPNVGTSLGGFDSPGNYLLQVYQNSSGSTNYELGFGFHDA